MVFLCQAWTIVLNWHKTLEEPDKDVEQPEGADGSEFAEGDDDDGEKKEYVKKDFVARPYISDGVTEEQVNSLIIKNSRWVKLLRKVNPSAIRRILIKL